MFWWPYWGRGLGFWLTGLPGWARWGFGGRGRGWRWMYWATGLPGWARFGWWW